MKFHTKPRVDAAHSLEIQGNRFYFFDIDQDDAGNSLLNFKQTIQPLSIYMRF